MKAYYILTLLITLTLLFSCLESTPEVVKYQNLTWQYETQDQFHFDVFIKDSVFHIQFYKEDTLTKKLIKTDSVNARILQWDNGYLIIENNNKKINDTIFYEVDNSTGINGLLLEIIKYDYWLPSLPPTKQDVIIPLKSESTVTVNTTNYWNTYPDDIEGLKCGDSISWDELEYFDTWSEYRLRKNQSISIRPSGGQILLLSKRDIPIGAVDSMVNSITKKLGFKPEEYRIGHDLPSYHWKKGLMKVSLHQEMDFNNNGALKQSYVFTVSDGESIALIELKRNSNDPDRPMRHIKENVSEIFQRAFKKEKVDEAIRTIDSALTIDPSCYLAHFFKADIKFNSGNINGAKFDCIKAYNLNPFYQPTLELLFIVYLFENEPEHATELVRQKEILINKTARSAQILGDYYRMIQYDLNTACKYYNLAFDRGYPNALKAVRDFCNN
jgi:hypothetical protein